VKESIDVTDAAGRYLPAFLLVTCLFFLWAIAHSLNDILIRQFQKALSLSRGQAGFIQFAFYMAYAVVALPAGIAMKKLGFKTAILIGLGLYACGALLFYPAAEVREYGAFLGALFVIASGIVFLETAGSGYITLTAPSGQAVWRINFSQSFNGVGAVLAPIIGGLFIFSGVEYTPARLAALSPEALDAFRAREALQVQGPYLGVAAVVLLVAGLTLLTQFATVSRLSRANAGNRKAHGTVATLLSHRNFIWAVIGQFFYVGAQIGSWSYFIDFTRELSPQTAERNAAFLLSASLAAFMIGRFVGTFIMAFIAPRRLLMIYAAINMVLVATAMMTSGVVAVVALASTSFFMSIMFPTTYALGLEDLGESAEIGSSVIIMSIISGAFIPPAIGFLADASSVQRAYVIPLFCYALVLLSAWLGGNRRWNPSPSFASTDAVQ
jgi:FHS family L-fucose permease-like MFS transporter